MEKSSKTVLFILLAAMLGLFAVLYFTFEPENEKPTPVVHGYDYILEVSNDNGTEIYTLYNEEHVLVADSITSKQLDSVIVEDNR